MSTSPWLGLSRGNHSSAARGLRAVAELVLVPFSKDCLPGLLPHTAD